MIIIPIYENYQIFPVITSYNVNLKYSTYKIKKNEAIMNKTEQQLYQKKIGRYNNRKQFNGHMIYCLTET